MGSCRRWAGRRHNALSMVLAKDLLRGPSPGSREGRQATLAGAEEKSEAGGARWERPSLKRKTLPGDPAQGLSLGAHRVLSGEKHRILNRDNDKPSGSGACNTTYSSQNLA